MEETTKKKIIVIGADAPANVNRLLAAAGDVEIVDINNITEDFGLLYTKEALKHAFQFLMVRLKGLIVFEFALSYIFQFLMVRLKVYHNGTICLFSKFQFLMVRLKAAPN